MRLTLGRFRLQSFLVFFTLRNVDTYMHMQRKRKLYEVDFRAVSTAIVLGFCTLSNVWFLVSEAFCECGQKFNESKSYLRSSLGLISLRHFFFRNAEKHGQRS